MASAQTIIYVNATAPSVGNGASWATAYNDLQTALQAAALAGPTQSSPIQIWVAQGVYKPLIPRVTSDPLSATFQVPSWVSVYGGFAGTETSLLDRRFRDHPSELSGDRLGDDAPGFTNRSDNVYNIFASYESSKTILVDGFKIHGGNASGSAGVFASASGAAFEFGSGTIYVQNCEIYDNSAAIQGGAFNIGYGDGGPTVGSVSAYISNCLIRDNRAAYAGAVGGGISSQQSGSVLIRLVNCTVVSNSATGQGSVMYLDSHVTAEVVNSVVWGNSGPSTGFTDAFTGGLFKFRYSTLQVVPSSGGVSENTASLYSDPLFGPASGTSYGLSAASSAIDSGSNTEVSGLFFDLAGNRRRAGSGPGGVPTADRGAFEFGSTPYVGPATLFLKAAAPAGGDGSSWDRALNDLQTGITYASNPDNDIAQLWVAAGTYKPTAPLSQGGSRSTSFTLQNNLALYGGFNGTETLLSQRNIPANPTILSGDLDGDDNGDLNKSDNSYHVVSVQALTSGAILDGFTIRGGRADGPNDDRRNGGGLICLDSSLTIGNCTFLDCQASRGGGTYIRNSTVLIDRCTYTSNAAVPTIDPRQGGALYLESGNSRVTDSLFEGNTARYGGAVYGAAGFVRCRFLRNSADAPNDTSAVGGAAYFTGGAVYNCEFYGNRIGTQGTPSTRQASAVASNGGTPMVNCAFVGNDGGPLGTQGALYATGDVVNCVFVSNSTPGGTTGALHMAGPQARVKNCIIWANSDQSGSLASDQLSWDNGSPLEFSYNIVQGWTGLLAGAGNSTAVPLFLRTPSPGIDNVWGTIDDDYGDLRLGPGSPAIDSGDSTAVPLDTYDLNVNGITTESLPFDLLGFPRFVDDPAVANTGVGTPPVDRGCYESQVNCLTCPGAREWRSPLGGAWDFAGNWFPSIPQPTHDTLFNLASTYSVTVPGAQSVSAN